MRGGTQKTDHCFEMRRMLREICFGYDSDLHYLIAQLQKNVKTDRGNHEVVKLS